MPEAQKAVACHCSLSQWILFLRRLSGSVTTQAGNFPILPPPPLHDQMLKSERAVHVSVVWCSSYIKTFRAAPAALSMWWCENAWRSCDPWCGADHLRRSLRRITAGLALHAEWWRNRTQIQGELFLMEGFIRSHVSYEPSVHPSSFFFQTWGAWLDLSERFTVVSSIWFHRYETKSVYQTLLKKSSELIKSLKN